jgi:hypothetical protein
MVLLKILSLQTDSTTQGVDDTEFLPDGGVRSYGVWTYNHKESGTEFETSYYSVQQFDEEGNTAFIWEFFDFGSIMLGLQ